MIKLVKLLVLTFLIILGAAFAVLNSQVITLDFYFSVIDLPVSVVIVAFMSIGALLGVMASSGDIPANLRNSLRESEILAIFYLYLRYAFVFYILLSRA